jgi:peptidoglycan/LPS O-acetylase OafA/YrhL
MRRERALKVVLLVVGRPGGGGAKSKTINEPHAKRSELVVGLLFLAAIYPITDSLWHSKQADYEGDMMLSIYFALGIFLLMAARNPAANRSLISFTGWSSLAHASVMIVMAIQKPDERVGFLLAVALFGVIGLLMILLTPPKHAERAAQVAPILP